ncbi:type II toxin-antitoxin system HicA family toxin [Ohtaekwangia sp.]|uniref:type II toxin-antitoxin system HicA family toxin n=1 Tax=Ohtaekwangia sp. TaxID=2066019 RepID=UPI0039C90C36
MSRFEKILLKLLQGNADQNFDFEDLVSLLKKLGFEFRIKGSHHIFFKEGIDEIITSI